MHRWSSVCSQQPPCPGRNPPSTLASYWPEIRPMTQGRKMKLKPKLESSWLIFQFQVLQPGGFNTGFDLHKPTMNSVMQLRW